jgi:hypothetical protein
MSFIFKKIVLFFILSIFFIKPSIAEITFQEILENPADLEINLKYATEQETLGRYKATLSTLERLNMLYPVNTDIKIYLLSILLKMDSEAKLQLMIETMLQDPNTTKETRDYIEGILNTIREQTKPKGKWFSYVDVNYIQTDNSNIDGVSKTGNLYAQDNISEFPGLRYDKTYSRGGSITIGKNLNTTSAISFNGGLSINTQNKGEENESDLSSGSISYSKVIGKHFILPYIFYSKSNERFTADLSTKGIGFNNSYNINKNNSISYSSSFSTTEYNTTAANKDDEPANADNEIYITSIGYNFSFSDVNLISSKISYTEKEALKDYNAYTGPGLNIGYTRILPFGTLKLEKTFQSNNYEEKNTFIHSTINREDDIETSQAQLSGRLTQLLPFIKKFDPESKIFYNFKYTEIDSDSSLLQNSSMRKNTSFSLVKRFSLYE